MGRPDAYELGGISVRPRFDGFSEQKLLSADSNSLADWIVGSLMT
jgi:hypothetical protein